MLGTTRQYPGPQNLYAPSAAQQNLLVQRVCYLLASGLLITALGAYIFRDAFNLAIPAFVVAFILLLLIRPTSRKPGLNVFVFYLFCLAEGAALGPFLAMYARIPHGTDLIWEAFLLTAITVAGVGSYAYTSGKDFGFLGKGLMWALLGLIIFGVASWFVVGLQTPVIFLGYDIIGIGIFVGFLLYDFSKIRLRYSPDAYTIAAVQVYLDFINLFLFILQMLSILQGGGGRRR
jgi:FtsH-binding integral membrane protein